MTDNPFQTALRDLMAAYAACNGVDHPAYERAAKLLAGISASPPSPQECTAALEEIKYLACTAGAPGHTPVPKALARILLLCNRAGVTKKLDELRPLFATTEDQDNV